MRGFDLSVSKNSLANYYLKSDQEFLLELSDYDPDFIGITCTTTNRVNITFWTEVLKKQLPRARILVGGPHPFFLPESYLRSNPAVDVLVLGEGEETIADYLEAVSEDAT